MPIELRDLVQQIARELAAARAAITAAPSPPASPSSGSRGATALFIESAEIQVPAYLAVSGARVLLAQTPQNRAFAKVERVGRISITLVPSTEDAEEQ
jgi:hypothetical protein